jgi:hypothetical protein
MSEPWVQIVRLGISRTVLLVGPLAIKVPTVRYGWAKFLRGLLANMQEREWARMVDGRLCPIVFSLPGGWLVVMLRARPLTDYEWRALDPIVGDAFRELPVERKSDSFGVLYGRYVAVDYGN